MDNANEIKKSQTRNVLKVIIGVMTFLGFFGYMCLCVWGPFPMRHIVLVLILIYGIILGCLVGVLNTKTKSKLLFSGVFLAGLAIIFLVAFARPTGTDPDKIFDKYFIPQAGSYTRIYDAKKGNHELIVYFDSTLECEYYTLYKCKGEKKTLVSCFRSVPVWITNIDKNIARIDEKLSGHGYESDSILLVFDEEITETEEYSKDQINLIQTIPSKTGNEYVYLVDLK